MYKIGSLFDGSGGFPLAGTLCGIEPAWASEVEPYPIAVTRSRFPQMKHLGDITRVNGAEIEPVDIITFGSPCQDLSVAGKQAGIKHAVNGDEETTRSGLFMEAVRVIKEMRRATNGKYPSFALWENVPGAFSSNKAEDFRIVLEELIKIVEPGAVMPDVPKGGWPYADCYVGDGWSIGYRLFDAQHWGVPQRRRRIHLVLDLTGERARDVLFEREGVRGYFAEGGTPWQATPADAQGSPGADDREGEGFDGYNGDLTGEVSATLGVNCGLSSGRNGVIEQRDGRGRQLDGVTSAGFCPEHTPCVAYSVENHPNDSHVRIDDAGKVQALTGRMGTGGGNVPMVMEPFCKSSRGKFKGDAETWKPADVANTMNTFDQGEARANELVVAAISVHDQATRFSGERGDKADGNGNGLGVGQEGDPMNTLTSGDRHAVVYAVDQGGGKSACNVTEGQAPTLTCTHGGAPAVAHASDAEPKVIALDRAAYNQGANAQYNPEITDSGINSTLVAKGPGAVAYALDQQGGKGAANYAEGVMPTMCGDSHGTPHAVCYEAPPRYIVRRLIPTECARLQGFPDWWSVVEGKKHLTDEEYSFWHDVRKTYVAIQADTEIAAARAAIAEEMERATPRQAVLEQKQRAIELAEGRKAKDYTEKQMLTWYNKLHTDSAEYKMWGNGIALPPALYVMQGIRDALDTPVEDDDWMN